jgi:ribosomal protein L37AE/L43A
LRKIEIKTGQTVTCPVCDKSQGDPVDDYVVQGKFGKVGPQSKQAHECEFCYAAFTVERIDPETYIVEAS